MNKIKSMVFFITAIVLIGFLCGYIYYQHSKISNLQTRLSSVEKQVTALKTRLSLADVKISSLQETIIPSSPTHAISSTVFQADALQPRLTSAASIQNALPDLIAINDPMNTLSLMSDSISSAYWNLTWTGKDYQLQQTAQEIASSYYQQHTYIPGQIDCIDMACDIWDILQKHGIISLIGVGNLEVKGAEFGQCNHAWLVIADSSGKCFVLEATNGQLYYANSPQISRYAECSLYAKPSDLRADIGSRW